MTNKSLKSRIAYSDIPTSMDDFNVKYIREGYGGKKDPNFMMDNPQFTPEAIEKRKTQRSKEMQKNTRKDLLEKFGNMA